jgi:hypothetical protein
MKSKGKKAAFKRAAPKKAKAKSKTPSAEELTRAFLKTPPMVEHARMLDEIQGDQDWHNEALTVEVAKPLLKMLEFVEHLEAADEGRKPEQVKEILSRILDNHLQAELHRLVVSPGSHRHYRDLWNAFCDKSGAPEHKIPDPGDISKDDGNQEPF